MDPKSAVDMIEASSKAHYSGFRMNGIVEGEQEMKNVSRQPFVIGMCLLLLTLRLLRWKWYTALVKLVLYVAKLLIALLSHCLSLVDLCGILCYSEETFCAGVCGGAASGKHTVCEMIIEQLHDQRVVLVNQVPILFP